jgi:hypothetical protein
MGIFFDQDWFDGRLEQAGLTRAAMARVTAERLVRHLRASGFVLMKRPDLAAPSTTEHIPR